PELAGCLRRFRRRRTPSVSRCPIEWSSVPMPTGGMRLLHVLTAGCLTMSLASASRPGAVQTATLKKAELDSRFLLQVSYEQKSGLQDFKTSRSRIVAFHREGAVLRMFDVSDTRSSAPTHAFATIPIRDEDRDTFFLDLNEGFDTVRTEEDR